MLYRFQSKACADVLMHAADARRLLQAMQCSDAPRGIVQWPDMPTALAHLAAAVDADTAQRAAAAATAAKAADSSPVHAHTAAAGDAREQAAMPSVSLSQRAAPMRQMLTRSMAEQADVVWGV